MKEFFQNLWTNISNFVMESGLLTAGIILIAGVVVIKVAISVLRKIFTKGKMEGSVKNYILTFIKAILYVVLLIMILNALGIDTSGILAIVATCSLAISLALQDTISSLANGIILITTKPFKQGDWINVGGQEGTIKSIRLLYTVLTTSDNKDIFIPNSKVISSEIINSNAHLTRKVIMTFDVSYDSDVDKVKEILNKIIKGNDLCLLEPEPIVRLKALNASSISFQIIMTSRTEDYWNLYYSVLDAVFNEFKKENISIPYDQLEVRLLNNEVNMPYRDMRFERTTDGKNIYDETEKDMIDKFIEKNLKHHHKKEEKK